MKKESTGPQTASVREIDMSPQRLAAASQSPDVELIPKSQPVQIQTLQDRLAQQVRNLGITKPVDPKSVRLMFRDRNGKEVSPSFEGWGDRSSKKPVTWRPLSERLGMADATFKATTSTIPASVKEKLDDENDILNSYWGWTGIIEPEYDVLDPWTIFDTESLYTRAVMRKTSLAFRNGVEITGENQAFVDYVKRRLKQIGFVTRLPFYSLVKEIYRHLEICSNCFVLKIRDTNASGGVANEKNKNRIPIAGYKIIPPHTLYPYMDGKGGIKMWRRFFGTGRPWRDYLPEDIIHFVWDRKPGHIFGTPRTTAFRDDVFALRRLEENYELLLINHLYPLFHVKVGTEEKPAQITPEGISELDVVRNLLQTMSKEGVLVTDERTSIDVHGAAKEGVDPNALMEHYFSRVLVGIGVSTLDLGITDTANRSTADNVSQNLKDAINADTQDLALQIQMQIFPDLFAESPSELSVMNATMDTRVEFHEIDMDTKIKQENHAMEAFNNNAITHGELRRVLKRKPLDQAGMKETHHELHTVAMAKLEHKQAKELQQEAHEHQANTATSVAGSTKTTKVTRKYANGGSHTTQTTEPAKGAAASVANKNRPANQHGKNLDPHKARSSQDPSLKNQFFDVFCELLERLKNQDQLQDWGVESALLCNALFVGGNAELDTLRDGLKVCLDFPQDMLQNTDYLYSTIETWFDMIPDVPEEERRAA